MESIKSMLKNLRLFDETDFESISWKTRDKDNIHVIRDKKSGVIFIDQQHSHEEDYKSGDYRIDGEKLYGKRDYEIGKDLSRRVDDYRQFYTGKEIVEFGCGEGSFLEAIKESTQLVTGVEVQEGYVSALNAAQIECVNNLSDTSLQKYDTLFCFHTLEHLNDPINYLNQFKTKIHSSGHIIIEVPHANDFLLKHLHNEDFKNFTLWGQHLILHTRSSLDTILRFCGFEKFIIQGKQRYGLSNHLGWLVDGKPGGHKGVISAIETNELKQAYENSLKAIDATDTLVAVITND